MFVRSIRKPCTTSALVARKVIGMPAGTTMHGGVNEYCWPTARTVTEPSGFERAAEIAFDEFSSQMQRAWVSRLDAGLWQRCLMHAGQGRHDHEHHNDDHGNCCPASLDPFDSADSVIVR